ncbi:hypothetical protein OQC17_004591 [Salmonella enterica]|nr:hypothetical protein [Salmonella enterica]
MLKKITPELKAIALAQVQQSKDFAQGAHDEYLTKCQTSYLYEACKLPGKLSEVEDIPKGVTPYVEPVLREAKKEAKPQIRDSFMSDSRLAVSLRSRGWNNHTDINDLITYNLNRVLLDENNGYGTFEKVIDEALGPGSAFAKVFVEDITNHDEATSDDWVNLADFMGMLSEGWQIDPPNSFADQKKGSVKGFEWKTSKESVTVEGLEGDKSSNATVIYIRGTIPLINRERKIRLEFVESKDIWCDTSYGHDFSKTRYLCHRILTTVGDAKKLGYDPELLENAAREDKDAILADLALTGVGDYDDNDYSTDPNERKIYLYEHYTYSSQFDKKGETKLYQIKSTANEVSEINEIPFIPFVHAKAKEVTGCFYGAGFFDEAKPFQDALTKKYRQADQVASVTAWRRFSAVKGAYDRQALLNSHRPGAVVEVQDQNAVMPFVDSRLDASFDKSYEMLRESEQQSLRRGFGSANLADIPPLAQATVALGIYHDAQRGLELCTTFKNTFVLPLIELLYKTMRYESWPLYDSEGREVEGAPYPSLVNFDVDINTAGDDAAQQMNLGSMIQAAMALTQIPAPYISEQNKYEILKFMGVRSDLDVTKFLTDPSTIPQDAAAQQMQLEQDALNHEATKVKYQGLILENQLTAAKIFQAEQEAVNGINKTQSDIAISHEESLNHIADIQQRAKAAADKVAVDNKRVNGDIILNAHSQRHDNQANGIM